MNKHNFDDVSHTISPKMEPVKIDKFDPTAQNIQTEPAKPALEHAQFEKLLGHWKIEWKNYYPDSPRAHGTAEFEAVLGGRHLVHRFKSEHLGKPFEGLGIDTYDKTKKKYVSTWRDSASTAILSFKGSYDPRTKTLNQIGRSNQISRFITMRRIITALNPDEFIVSIFIRVPLISRLPGVGETKLMEVTYRRE